MGSKAKTNKFLKEAFSTGVYFLVVFLLAAFVLKFVGQRSVVDGSSMNDTLYDGESVWVNKFTYRFNEPERFDIVVFPYKYAENTFFIKRIIGLPGETVQIRENGDILINGEVLEENYGKEVIHADRLGTAVEPITLGVDEYFVLGDNRNDSMDSRYPNVGPIKKDEFIGKAVFRLFPVTKMGGIE
ncbi:MAG: signal peptidase I [Lachnospiraceae bacterium]|nr:signal peptidase I [Lachnospiraceae bacterium]